MEEPQGSPVLDPKDSSSKQSKRTSGFAGMFQFSLQQRPAQDADNDPRSCDRPRKAGLGGGGKVKPGGGGGGGGSSSKQHRRKASASGSGDLSQHSEPLSPPAPGSGYNSGCLDDSPSAAWAAQCQQQQQQQGPHAGSPMAPGGGMVGVTDTLALSPLSASSAAAVTPGSQPKPGLFNKLKRLASHSKDKGGGSPALPSSPTLPGATPTHGSAASLTFSANSSAGGAYSQSPSDSLAAAAPGGGGGGNSTAAHCRGLQGGARAGSSTGGGSARRSSGSGDVGEEADFGSCYSDALHSPHMGYQEDVCGGDTLDLRQGMYGAASSPLASMHQEELPDVFTPGFASEIMASMRGGGGGGNALLREPDTPLEEPTTTLLEPTVALLTSAQLAQAGVNTYYEAPDAMLLEGAGGSAAPAAAPAAAQQQDSGLAAGAAEQSPASPAGSSLPLAASATPAAAAAAAGGDAAVPLSAEAAGEAVQQDAPAEPDSAAAAEPVHTDDVQLELTDKPAGSPAAAAAAAAAVNDAPRAAVTSPAQQPAAVAESPAPEEAAAAPAASPAQSSPTPVTGTDTAAAQAGAEPGVAAVGSAVRRVSGAGSASPPAAAMAAAAAAAGEVAPAPAEDRAALEAAAASEADAAAAVPDGELAAATAAAAGSGAVTSDEAAPQLAAHAAAVDQGTRQPAASPDAAAASAAPAGAEAAAAAQRAEAPATAAARQDQQEQRAQPDSPVPAAAAAAAAAASEVASPPGAAAEPPHTPAGAGLQAEGSSRSVGSARSRRSDVSSHDIHLAEAEDAAGPAAHSGDGPDATPAADEQVEAQPEQQPEDVASPAAAATVPPGGAEEQEQAPEPCEELELLPEASEEPVVPEETGAEPPLPPQQQDGNEPLPSTPLPLAMASLSPLRSAGSAAARRGSAGGRRTTPRAPVRESLPLLGLSGALPGGLLGGGARDSSDDLQAQELQQLTDGGYRPSGGAAAAPGGRLLAHGGPQRVNVGGGLAPVQEQYSPIPEECSSGGSGASARSKASSRYEAAASGSPHTSPVRAMALDGGCQPGASPVLGGAAATPGSTYSTPTLAMGGARGGAGELHTQVRLSPPSAVSSAVGSAIRAAGQGLTPVDRGVSPGMPGLPDVSPTLTLLPSMTQAGGPAGQGAGGGDGTTPSLLDARTASPSAVYAPLYAATPYRGALAALPIDAAVKAPLVDNSPFTLTDDGMDTVRLADEANRVAMNLAAAAAGGFGHTPLPARTPAPRTSPAPPPTGARRLPDRAAAASPTAELENLQISLLTRQLAEAQKGMRDLEGEVSRLREQVEIYEFEKTELNSQEEMEKAARQYAEEQLQAVQGELQAALQAAAGHANQAAGLRAECEGLRAEAAAQHDADLEVAAQLQQRLAQLQGERNAALDRVNLLDMELTAVKSNAGALQAALGGEQGRCADLEAALADKDRKLAETARAQYDTQAQLEKLMEQVIAAQTAKEHAKQKAHDEAAKAQQLMAERQQLFAERQQVLSERDRYAQEYQHLKERYLAKSAALKEAEARCSEKEAENQELMGMCDQLLQQQEARR